MIFYRWLISILVWWSADPAVLDLEAPKAAAAVSAAAASMAVEAAPKPRPAVCGNCKGTGWITMPDGHKVQCQQCKGTGGCPDGTCPKKPKPA